MCLWRCAHMPHAWTLRVHSSTCTRAHFYAAVPCGHQSCVGVICMPPSLLPLLLLLSRRELLLWPATWPLRTQAAPARNAYQCMLPGLLVVTLTLTTCNRTQLRIGLSCLHLHALPASADTAIAGWTPAPPTRHAFQCIACTRQHQHALPALHQQAPALLLCSSFRSGVTRAVPRSGTAALRCVLAQVLLQREIQQQPPHGKNGPSNIRSQCNTTHNPVQVHALSHSHATNMLERASKRERPIGAPSARNTEARRSNSMLCTQQHALHASECPACTSMAC
jgi:hypothetical protein